MYVGAVPDLQLHSLFVCAHSPQHSFYAAPTDDSLRTSSTRTREQHTHTHTHKNQYALQDVCVSFDTSNGLFSIKHLKFASQNGFCCLRAEKSWKIRAKNVCARQGRR